MFTELRARACSRCIGIVFAAVAAVTFFPGELAAQSPSVTATPTTVAPGGTITVTVANGPGNATDWVALASTSAPLTTYVDWKYLNDSTLSPPVPGLTGATVHLTAPATPGQYEVRFFALFGFTVLATSNPITVQGAPPSAPTVTASPASVSPGGVITVTVANGPGNPNDWVTLGSTSATDSTYLSWKYLTGSTTPPATGLTNATIQFVAPMTSGTYNLRLFANDTWAKLATSNAVSVGTTTTPTLTINTASVPEGNSGTAAATFTVTLTPTSAQTVTVAYATANGTATAGSDYVAASGTLTFAPGVATRPLAVSVTGDTTTEPDETFVVTLSSPTNAVLGSTQGAGTILNDDAATSGATVTATPASVAPGGVITVTVANGPGNPNDWVTLGPTSGPDTTYLAWKYLTGSTVPPPTGLPNATLQFVAPATPGTYNVRLFENDSLNRLATSNTVTVGTGATPTLTINTATVPEGNSGTTPATFTVTLTPTSAQTVTVAYATANGTATAGSDYVAASGTLTFAPGVATRPLAVSVTGDATVEPNETFVVNLSSPVNAVLGSTQGAGTITNDDVASAATVTATPASVAPGGVITVTVANGPGNTNDWLTLGLTSAADQTYVAWKYLNGSATPPGVGLTTATVQFVAPMAPGTYSVRFFANDTWTRLGTSSPVTVQTVPSLTINAASVPEGDSGTTAATFTVTLTPTSTQTVTVAYATANGTATAGSDYVAANGTLTFAPGVATRPLAVSVTGDTTVEPNETFVVNLSSPVNAVLGSTQGAGTITNDDTAAGATVTAMPASVAPGGVITVTVANGPGNTNDWVTLGLTSAADQTYVAWKYLTGSTTPPATGLTNATLQFVAPMTAGTYNVRLFANDTLTRLATSAAVTASDSTAPVITNVTASSITATGATITWTTNEGSDSQVDYGPTTAYGSTSALNSNLVTSHTITLGGLTSATLYHYRVRSRDAAGNLATSADFTFSTLDATPPTISAVAASAITATSATISWTTNEASDTQVNYGPTTAYGTSTSLNGSLVTAHTASLSGLTASSVYHYRVRSRDAAGNLALSGDLTFTTLAGDVTPPTVALTAPAANATVSGVITVSATASDAVGVAGVEFRLDGAPLGAEDVSSPYSISWNTTTATPGNHTLTAVARDAATNQTTSAARSVTVANLSTNLIAAYAYNEGAGSTAADGSVNSNTATLSGTSWSTSCQFGACLALNGTSSFVDTPDDDVLTPGVNATFEAWVFLTVAPTEIASVFNKWSQTLDDEYIFGVNPNRTLFFGWHTTGGDTFPSPAFNLVNGTGAIPLNTWTHIAVVRSGPALTFYRNGIIDASQTVLDTQPFRNGTATLRIGGQSRGGANRFFPGRIDEARIYNEPLTQAEIQSDMNTPIALDTTPPVLSAMSASAITAFGATIGWTTNEASDSQVDYGPTTAYGSVSPLNGSLVTSHAVIVGALAANTTYHFRVRSKDSAGNLAVSGDFTFTTLVVDLTAPVVTITAPAANATVSGTVTFSANATDNVGVTGVEFKRDGTNLAPEDTVAPYTVAWDTTTASQGLHTLTAVAWDAAGNQATATRTVTVANAPAQVRLAWDPNTEADLAGYRVKVGTSSGVYSLSNITVGNVTSYTVTGLAPGNVYYFAVTAYDQGGAESVVSNEVSAAR